MQTPTYEQSPLDPAFAQLMKSSQQQDIAAIQEKLQGDQASYVARFGAGRQQAIAAAMGMGGATPVRA